MYLVYIEKLILPVALVIFNQLRFEQFHKQNAVHPSDGKLQGNTEEAFLHRIAILTRIVQSAHFVEAVQFVDGIFYERPRIALALCVTSNHLFATLFALAQPHYV